MIRRSTLVALLGLAACAGEAESEAAPETTANVLPAVTWHDPAPAAVPAPAIAAAPETTTAAAPVAEAVASPAAPSMAARETPAAPEQTEPDIVFPLTVECLHDECGACWADVRAAHPAEYELGTASCSARECVEDGECADMGADVVCRKTAAGPGRTVCRLPRLDLGAPCAADPATSAEECEVGLACARVGIAGLHCVASK